MAIWNISPDSFSSFCEADGADSFAHAERLCKEGADILDIGAESTRPGAVPISEAEEIQRLKEPLLWARTHLHCPISLDSRHPGTIEWALSEGLADIVNDIGASARPGDERDGRIYRAAARANAGLVVMAWEDHNAEILPFDVCLKKIYEQLAMRVEFAVNQGVDRRSIVVDPGIGFGKGMENDLRLITHAPKALADLGCPVLIAHSRKRCLARLTGLGIESLDLPTAIASAMAFCSGAAMVRVHQPGESVIARQLFLSSSPSFVL